ncbi:dedicator of cytokinesis dock [Anaeramoeba flamelloides]|uniref:Dedicator of cytokinesis dock n=1 Tax=Anaeramoeba flamelloides TaxID=1746091 RepID=A0ABQ8ZDL9_9EUKA|nr:dedicator of cytokinesis dock [Anaeramoeba flamelloides]
MQNKKKKKKYDYDYDATVMSHSVQTDQNKSQLLIPRYKRIFELNKKQPTDLPSSRIRKKMLKSKTFSALCVYCMGRSLYYFTKKSTAMNFPVENVSKFQNIINNLLPISQSYEKSNSQTVKPTKPKHKLVRTLTRNYFELYQKENKQKKNSIIEKSDLQLPFHEYFKKVLNSLYLQDLTSTRKKYRTPLIPIFWTLNKNTLISEKQKKIKKNKRELSEFSQFETETETKTETTENEFSYLYFEPISITYRTNMQFEKIIDYNQEKKIKQKEKQKDKRKEKQKQKQKENQNQKQNQNQKENQKENQNQNQKENQQKNEKPMEKMNNEKLYCSVLLYDSQNDIQLSEKFYFILPIEKQSFEIGDLKNTADKTTQINKAIFKIPKNYQNPISLLIHIEKTFQGDYEKLVEPILNPKKNTFMTLKKSKKIKSNNYLHQEQTNDKNNNGNENSNENTDKLTDQNKSQAGKNGTQDLYRQKFIYIIIPISDLNSQDKQQNKCVNNFSPLLRYLPHDSHNSLENLFYDKKLTEKFYSKRKVPGYITIKLIKKETRYEFSQEIIDPCSRMTQDLNKQKNKTKQYTSQSKEGTQVSINDQKLKNLVNQNRFSKNDKSLKSNSKLQKQNNFDFEKVDDDDNDDNGSLSNQTSNKDKRRVNKNISIKEIQYFPQLLKLKPFTKYINDIYLYPISLCNFMFLKNYKYILIKMEYKNLDNLNTSGLKQIYGKYNEKSYVSKNLLTIKKIRKNLKINFQDEIKIALKSTFSEKDHFLFTFYKITKMKDDYENNNNVIGYSILPINSETISRNEIQSLKIFNRLDKKNYLNNLNDQKVSNNNNSSIENIYKNTTAYNIGKNEDKFYNDYDEERHFNVILNLKSSIYPKNKTINELFNNFQLIRSNKIKKRNSKIPNYLLISNYLFKKIIKSMQLFVFQHKSIGNENENKNEENKKKKKKEKENKEEMGEQKREKGKGKKKEKGERRGKGKQMEREKKYKKEKGKGKKTKKNREKEKENGKKIEIETKNKNNKKKDLEKLLLKTNEYKNIYQLVSKKTRSLSSNDNINDSVNKNEIKEGGEDIVEKIQLIQSDVPMNPLLSNSRNNTLRNQNKRNSVHNNNNNDDDDDDDDDNDYQDKSIIPNNRKNAEFIKNGIKGGVDVEKKNNNKIKNNTNGNQSNVIMEKVLNNEKNFIVLEIIEKIIINFQGQMKKKESVQNEDSKLYNILKLVLYIFKQKKSNLITINLLKTLIVILREFKIQIFEKSNIFLRRIIKQIFKHNIIINDSQISRLIYCIFYLLLLYTFKYNNNKLTKIKIVLDLTLEKILKTINKKFTKNEILNFKKVITNVKLLCNKNKDELFKKKSNKVLKDLQNKLLISFQMHDNKYDLEFSADLLRSTADLSRHRPIYRFNWFQRLEDLMCEEKNYSEIGLIKLHQSAMIFAYLNFMRPKGCILFSHDDDDDDYESSSSSSGGGSDVNFDVGNISSNTHDYKFNSIINNIHPSIKEEFYDYDNKIPNLKFIKKDYFSVKGLIHCLGGSLINFQKSNTLFYIERVSLLLITILKLQKNYKRCSIINNSLSKIYQKYNENKNGNFNTDYNYYKICFFGKKFNADNNKKFIYKYPLSIRITDLLNIFKEKFAPKFKKEIENLIVLSEFDLDVNNIDPNKYYITIKSVSLLINYDFNDLGDDDDYLNNDYLNPLKARHVKDYYSERTLKDKKTKEKKFYRNIYTVKYPFPYITTRQEIIKIQNNEISSIETAIIDICKKNLHLLRLLNLPKIPAKQLSLILNGSLLTMVNAGPFSLVQTHLTNQEQNEPKFNYQLKQTFKHFFKITEIALNRFIESSSSEYNQMNDIMKESLFKYKELCFPYLFDSKKFLNTNDNFNISKMFDEKLRNEDTIK